MKRNFWIVYLALSCASAFGQSKPEVTPELTKDQRHALADRYADMNYARAELMEYMSGLEIKHPGWKLRVSQDEVWSYFKTEPTPTPAKMLPGPVPPVKK